MKGRPWPLHAPEVLRGGSGHGANFRDGRLRADLHDVTLESLRFIHLRRVVGTALSALGVEAAEALARRLARGMHGLDTPARRRAEAALGVFLEGQPASVRASSISREMYEHIARFLVEATFIPRMLRETSWRRRVAIDAESQLRELADSPRGCLVATACFGNPAVAACVLGRIFRPIHVVVDWSAQPILRAWQRDVYRQPWVRPLDRREAARSIPGLLANGRAVLLLADQARRRGPAISARFLDRTLPCYPTLARLSRWHDVPVAVVMCRREPQPMTFRLRLEAIVAPPRAANEEADVVQEMLAAMEGTIRAAPEQYLWSLLPTEPSSSTSARQTVAPSRPAASWWEDARSLVGSTAY